MGLLSFDQTIHGYDDGHQLLAGSLYLTGAAATTVLILSDISGSTTSVPDSGYLTGYPLSDGSLYALGVTWSAPEMPRPGCVWTHTIFVRFEDLAIIDDCLSLRQLFRRPSNRKDLQPYERKIVFQNVQRRSGAVGQLRTQWIRMLLYALYANPSKAIVVRPVPSFDAEQHVLSMWEQQWPGLRRAFRFCTHSGGELSTPVGTFDVSIMPQVAAQIQPLVDPRVLVVDLATQTPVDKDDWVSRAAQDITSPGELRRVLRSYAADVSAGRAAFASFCDLFAILESRKPEAEKVLRAGALLDQKFPPQEANVARRLVMREAVLGVSSPGPEIKKLVVKHMDLLTPEDYGQSLSQASRWLFTHCLPEAWRLFERAEPAFSFAKAFILKAREGEIVAALGLDTHRTAAVLEIRPDLLTSRSFWQSSEPIIREALNHVCLTDRLSIEVLSRMLRAGGIELARHVSKELPVQKLFSKLITLSDADPPEIESEVWHRWLLASCPETEILATLMTEGLPRTQVTLGRLARVVKPTAVPNQVDRDPWVIAYENAKGVVSSTERKHFFCFLLARAFSRVSKQTGRLLTVALDTVYAAAKQNDLAPEDWGLVSEAVGSQRWWLAWDRCGTLRFTIAELCSAGMLTPDEFLSCTGDDETFAALAEELSQHWWSRNFLRKVAQEASRTSSGRAAMIRHL